MICKKNRNHRFKSLPSICGCVKFEKEEARVEKKGKEKRKNSTNFLRKKRKRIPKTEKDMKNECNFLVAVAGCRGEVMKKKVFKKAKRARSDPALSSLWPSSHNGERAGALFCVALRKNRKWRLIWCLSGLDTVLHWPTPRFHGKNATLRAVFTPSGTAGGRSFWNFTEFYRKFALLVHANF